jgi:NADPH:quinone reductase-like Zn-dependent oxidoreductase
MARGQSDAYGHLISSGEPREGSENFASVLVPSTSSEVAEDSLTAAQSNMKAVRIHNYGGVEVLKYEEAPRPTPSDNDLLVRVHAAGVNPLDAHVRGGKFAAFLITTLPLVMGWDVSGVVEQTGKKVTRFKVGDAVYACMRATSNGADAEYTIVPERDACSKPAKLTHVEAAAVPLAATTAWQALFDTAKLEKGQTVLIHGGSGGVGHFAIQLAKAHGAKVIATGSAKNLSFLSELGADLAIDYSATKFEDVAKGVDVVLDTVGGETQERSFDVLKKGGILVSIAQPPDQEIAKAAGVRAVIFLSHPDGATLAEISKLVDAGKLKPTVSKTYALSDAVQAHEQIETKHTKGKIVFAVIPDAAVKQK